MSTPAPTSAGTDDITLTRTEMTRLAAQRRAVQLNRDPTIPTYLHSNVSSCG